MAAVRRAAAVVCELPSEKPPSKPRLPEYSSAGGKIILQPRLCTLRTYGSGGDRDAAVVRAPRLAGDGKDASSGFFASLAAYVESARTSHDFEIISGRLAMIVFAAAVGVEAATGSSLFKKLDAAEIGEAAGVCVAVVACAAAFAWASSGRRRIGEMVTLGCNAFVDYLVDGVVEALFSDADFFNWNNKL